MDWPSELYGLGPWRLIDESQLILVRDRSNGGLCYCSDMGMLWRGLLHTRLYRHRKPSLAEPTFAALDSGLPCGRWRFLKRRHQRCDIRAVRSLNCRQIESVSLRMQTLLPRSPDCQ
jgi:hypothetical protein